MSNEEQHGFTLQFNVKQRQRDIEYSEVNESNQERTTNIYSSLVALWTDESWLGTGHIIFQKS